MKNTLPPHAELIKAWADGAVIQYKPMDNWIDVPHNRPKWFTNTKYRIKPELKSDAELLWIAFGGNSKGFHDLQYNSAKNRYYAVVEEFNRLKQEQENAS